MNRKDFELSGIVDIVVDCCKSAVYSDTAITKTFGEWAYNLSTEREKVDYTQNKERIEEIDRLLNEMEAMRYSDYCIALQIVYWHLFWGWIIFSNT